MNLSNRLLEQRKIKGISQEELANEIGVSRQAVSKWESGQSVPDIEKLLCLSDFYNVSLDYLVKGIPSNNAQRSYDLRIFSIIATAINILGLITSIIIWNQYQVEMAVAVGLALIVIGLSIYFIGYYLCTNKTSKIQAKFWIINIWIIALIPYSLIVNFVQAIIFRYSIIIRPTIELGNSIIIYLILWIMYTIICVLIDKIIAKKMLNK